MSPGLDTHFEDAVRIYFETMNDRMWGLLFEDRPDRSRIKDLFEDLSLVERHLLYAFEREKLALEAIGTYDSKRPEEREAIRERILETYPRSGTEGESGCDAS